MYNDETLSEDIKWLHSELQQCSNSKYYGKLVITIQEGKIVLVKKETDLKPPSFYKQLKKN